LETLPVFPQLFPHHLADIIALPQLSSDLHQVITGQLPRQVARSRRCNAFGIFMLGSAVKTNDGNTGATSHAKRVVFWAGKAWWNRHAMLVRMSLEASMISSMASFASVSKSRSFSCSVPGHPLLCSILDSMPASHVAPSITPRDRGLERRCPVFVGEVLLAAGRLASGDPPPGLLVTVG